MILGSDEEQDQMTCHIQEWQFLLFKFPAVKRMVDYRNGLCLSVCPSVHPSVTLSWPLHISWTLWKIFIKLWSNVCLSESMCRTHVNHANSRSQVKVMDQTTGRPAIGHSSNGQKDISDQLGMPGHWPPGMPGHRPPITGHSLTTGQVDDIETSSLPITGHRPSSHRSLDLERLNTVEIQE